MPPVGSLSKLTRLAAVPAQQLAAFALTATLHLAALGLMFWSETGTSPKLYFLLAWALLNFAWLAVLRRPSIAAALSLAMIFVLIQLSRLKHETLFMTATFEDLMIIDEDTTSFLLMIVPGLGVTVALSALAGIAALYAAWRIDCHRVRPHTASVGGAVCFSALSALTFAAPGHIDDKWSDNNYVSKFARSAAVAATDYFTYGILEADSFVGESLKRLDSESCPPRSRAPHIIMVLDESSMDMRMVPGIKLPKGYGRHFLSIDGRQRTFLTEGAGGPTWFTEYNVLTGLSSRSYGRFADAVTRFAAGRVERGLPHALSRCGYRTFSLYPWRGNFLGARGFQTSSGIETFLDAKYLGSLDNEPDSFYYGAARRLIASEREDGPMFVFVYTMANHFPWNYRFAPELAPDWRDPGNAPEIDEYLRRQHMSEQDYRRFRAQLANEFRGERFLIVRFGDHQPLFAKHIVDPKLDDPGIAQKIAEYDPRFYATYYAIDAINYRPTDLRSAIGTLDAPYLPLVVLEAAGVPLDPSFTEQKKIFLRCNGMFYQCDGGAEASRFNRMLIDAGLIKNL